MANGSDDAIYDTEMLYRVSNRRLNHMQGYNGLIEGSAFQFKITTA